MHMHIPRWQSQIVKDWLREKDIISFSNCECFVARYFFVCVFVLQWTSTSTGFFQFQNCFNSSWHRFNKVMETFPRNFGPNWHDGLTQLVQICQLHICKPEPDRWSQRELPKVSRKRVHGSWCRSPISPHPKGAPFGLWFGECGGHWSTVNSLPCSWNQLEMIWALWCGGSAIRRWVQMDGPIGYNTQVGCGV